MHEGLAAKELYRRRVVMLGEHTQVPLHSHGVDFMSSHDRRQVAARPTRQVAVLDDIELALSVVKLSVDDGVCGVHVGLEQISRAESSPPPRVVGVGPRAELLAHDPDSCTLPVTAPKRSSRSPVTPKPFDIFGSNLARASLIELSASQPAPHSIDFAYYDTAVATVSSPPARQAHDRERSGTDETDTWGADAVARRMSLHVALRRRPFWVLIPTVLLCIGGIAAGWTRPPTYTAQSSLIIGTSDPASPNFSGNVVAAGSLATAYSRAIIASPVVDSVSKSLGMSRSAVTSDLSSAPLPSSPEFTVSATGDSAKAAINLANAASSAIIKYLGSLNSGSGNQQLLLSEYQAAAAKVSQDIATRAPKARRARDQLVVSGIASAYSAALAANPAAPGVSPFTSAFAATSDRKSTAELLGFIGLIAGLLVGLALAVLLGNQEIRHLSRG